jgi:hypothetical protein
MSTVVEELVKQNPAEDMAPAEDGSESEGAMTAAPGETPEEKAMLLLEVVQAAVMLALDGGLSVDSKSFLVELADDGSVSVTGSDDAGTELAVVSSLDDLLSLLDE